MPKDNYNNLINQASKVLNSDSKSIENSAKSGDYSQL